MQMTHQQALDAARVYQSQDILLADAHLIDARAVFETELYAAKFMVTVDERYGEVIVRHVTLRDGVFVDNEVADTDEFTDEYDVLHYANSQLGCWCPTCSKERYHLIGEHELLHHPDGSLCECGGRPCGKPAQWCQCSMNMKKSAGRKFGWHVCAKCSRAIR